MKYSGRSGHFASLTESGKSDQKVLLEDYAKKFQGFLLIKML